MKEQKWKRTGKIVKRKMVLLKLSITEIEELQIVTSKYHTILEVGICTLLFRKLFEKKIKKQLSCFAALENSSKIL